MHVYNFVHTLRTVCVSSNLISMRHKACGACSGSRFAFALLLVLAADFDGRLNSFLWGSRLLLLQ